MRRIAQLRDYHFDHAPELAGYLPNPAERLPTPGLGIRLRQQFLTVAGMVAVITAVLSDSAAGLLAAVASDHSPTPRSQNTAFGSPSTCAAPPTRSTSRSPLRPKTAWLRS